jgi:hypothetical protein
MGMLPAEFFTADYGIALLVVVIFLTFVGPFVSRSVRAPELHYAKLAQQQRLIELHAYAARLRASSVVRSTETLHASPAPVLGLSHDNRPTSDGTDTPTITTHENRLYCCVECGVTLSTWPMCEACVIENMQPSGVSQ